MTARTLTKRSAICASLLFLTACGHSPNTFRATVPNPAPATATPQAEENEPPRCGQGWRIDSLTSWTCRP